MVPDEDHAMNATAFAAIEMYHRVRFARLRCDAL